MKHKPCYPWLRHCRSSSRNRSYWHPPLRSVWVPNGNYPNLETIEDRCYEVTNRMEHLKAKKKKSLRFLVIGRLQNRCGDALFFPSFFCFGPAGKYVIHIIYAGTKCPMYKVWWLREASQISQTFILLCEKSFKAQHGRIPIDLAILWCNWTSFHSKK